jgi:hypothetical protein
VGGRKGCQADRATLRKLGIRTATDLLDVADRKAGSDPAFREAFLRVLNRDAAEPSAVEGIRRSLAREVNLQHVVNWKAHAWLPN